MKFAAEHGKKVLIVLVLIAMILASISIIAPKAASPQWHQSEVTAIDEKIKTVMELTAASTASSALISAIPDDTGTPIAEKLADISSYFLIVLSALYLEKYLLTVTGFAAFYIVIPIAGLLLIGAYLGRSKLKSIGLKMLFFGAAIYLLIPVSLKVSDLIYENYQTSIESVIEDAKEYDEEETSVSGISWITDKIDEAVDKASETLSHYIEVLAVMIVTTCLIPLVVMAFMIALVKMFLQIDFSIPVKSGKVHFSA